MNKKYIVRQNDIKDCGICCLESIIKYYNGFIPLEQLRLDTKTGHNGTTAYNLIKTAKKYGFNVWDGPSLSAYIVKTYSVKLCVRQCQRIFHKLGFSLVRPQTFPNKGEKNEEERNEYKKK